MKQFFWEPDEAEYFRTLNSNLLPASIFKEDSRCYHCYESEFLSKLPKSYFFPFIDLGILLTMGKQNKSKMLLGKHKLILNTK